MTIDFLNENLIKDKQYDGLSFIKYENASVNLYEVSQVIKSFNYE